MVCAAAPSAAAVVFFACILLSGLGDLRPVTARAFLYYVVISPVSEELLFRAVLQRFLTRRGLPLFAAAAVSSAVFSCAHLFFSSAAHSAAVFLPSLVFGFVYGRTGSLAASSFVHAVFNMNVFINYQSDILEIIF